MRLFQYIEGLKTYIREEGLLVRVNNQYTAWHLKNKIELQGYPVSVEKNNDHYIVSIWGANLMDAYLLKNQEGFAA